MEDACKAIDLQRCSRWMPRSNFGNQWQTIVLFGSMPLTALSPSSFISGFGLTCLEVGSF
jgi:hypothetical protein